MIPGIMAAGARRATATGRLTRRALDFGPVGFWSLVEAGAVQTDEVAGARNGTRTGGAVVAAQLAVDGAQAFDPQGTGLIRIPSVTGLDVADFTICVDFQYTTPANLVIAEHGDKNQGWSLQSIDTIVAGAYRVPAGTLGFVSGLSGARLVAVFSDVLVNDGAPHRAVVVALADGSATIYLDGRLSVQRGAAPTFGVRSYNKSYIDIGSRNGVSGLPAGSRIANFALFNRALSASEATALSI